MIRRDLPRIVGVIASWMAICAAHVVADSSVELRSRRPNIILILTDDQGYGDLGRNGNPIIQTPHLDRLYDQSVRFEDFHVSPTCAPTRCALLTGRHEFKSGVTHTIYERERMSLKATTLAQILKTAGYATGIFGKWHMGDEAPYQPNQRGFDEVFVHGAGGIGQSYPGSCGDAPGNTYFDPVILHNGSFEKTSGYCTDVFFEQAGKWITSRRGQGPFFCYITPNAPHTPHQVPPKYEQMYTARVAEFLKIADPANYRVPAGKYNALAEVSKFLGMVTNIDENVGHLLDQLRDWGIERDTLVIFMNDNGGTDGSNVFNAGMRASKGTAHNGGTRAMCFWRWPGTLEPAAADALTAHVDIFPTLAELAGARIPQKTAADLEGYSLVPLLQNAKASWHEERMLFTHVGRWEPGKPSLKFGDCSVRWQQYLYFPAASGGMLYDLKSDPAEKTDIARQHPDVVARLGAAYDRWWDETTPCLVNENAYETAPKVNPYRELYWRQFQGPGPNHVTFEPTTAPAKSPS